MDAFLAPRHCRNPNPDAMEIMSSTLLGLAAGICTTLAFVPQVLRTWRTRSTEDISLGMFVIFVFGVFLWLLYGIARSDIVIIGANVVTLGLAGTILYFKLRYG
jgi:MtN3 and saliva related transmembrane protein